MIHIICNQKRINISMPKKRICYVMLLTNCWTFFHALLLLFLYNMYLLYGVQGGGPPRPPHTYYGEIKRASPLASQKVNITIIYVRSFISTSQVKSRKVNFYWRPLPYNKKKHGIQTLKNVSLYTVIYIDCNSKKSFFYILRKL